MAMLMLTGGKIGDIIGRRRAFVVGLIIYACGSTLTAVSQTVAQLALGWSILEGIGAALVLPAMAALIAGNFERSARTAVIGASPARDAIGPISEAGPTELSWRVVFVGEVVSCRHPPMTPFVAGSHRAKPRLDVVGRSSPPAGVVLGTLIDTWGVEPKDSPVEPFGFA
jgi:MFS family permease